MSLSMMAERADSAPQLERSGSGSAESSPTKERTTPAKSKDPLRPKRKKARRACAACQRAHLTCGDERPCERCIKRGLQDDCHDGARKKAKYLRDAPDEALKPGAGAYYRHNQMVRAQDSPKGSLAQSSTMAQANGFVENRPPSMHGFTSVDQRPQTQDTSSFHQYPNQTSPLSAQFSPHQDATMSNLQSGFQQTLDGQNYSGAFMDPSDTALFGFDTASLNFGNQYGALEFGVLGHMASGANNATVHRTSSGYDGTSMGHSAYVGNDMNAYAYSQNPDWPATDPRMNSWGSHTIDSYDGRVEPHTYTIGNAPATFMGASPASTGTDYLPSFEGTSPDSNFASTSRRTAGARAQSGSLADQDSMNKPEQEHRPSKAVSKRLEQLPPAAAIQQRRRNASKIYTTVINPYPYTARFHALIAAIQRRFKSQKRLRIAKALAAIRPSFISCTRTLIKEDLILMEKNFQRSLLEYRDHVSSCGTPTIICRRTGEVAYCGESFLLLSGWPVGVLLGKEPNLNINRATDEEASGSLTTSSRGGFTTPKAPAPAAEPEPAVPQPVFLADLLDDDSVIQFYEDFAKIAFADSKGSACRPCKLLKYRTKGDPWKQTAGRRDSVDPTGDDRTNSFQEQSANDRMPGPHVQQDISSLGEDGGTVDCMFCWTVKRDVFEVPMMIVINFLPILQN